jgi:hydroxymethylpyrimidine/phosphomethylpyrimidine kinase
VHALGPRWVLVKGGHLLGRPTDLLYDGTDAVLLEGERVDTAHTHGTGCVLASALAGYLALGDDVPTAARKAKAFVTAAIRRGYPLGAGPGPVSP